MADFTGLDWMFTCPQVVTADEIRAGYETLKLRLRLELANAEVSTVQLMRFERMLGVYAKLRQAERVPYGEAGGFTGPGAEKDVNAFWQSLAKDCDDISLRSRPQGSDAVKSAVEKFKQVVVDALAAAGGDTPEALRQDFTARMVQGVVHAGLDV